MTHIKQQSCKKKCKELGLPFYGRKKDIIDRLNNHKPPKIVDDNDENDEEERLQLSESDDNEDDENFRDVSLHRSVLEPSWPEQETRPDKQKQPRAVYDYRRDVTTYTNIDEARDKIKAEDSWKKHRTRDSKNGVKIDYDCKYSACKMRLFIQLVETNESTIIWRTTGEHSHVESEKTQFGMNAVTKGEIEILYKSSVNTSKRIQNALRDRENPHMPKKFLQDQDVSFY